MEGGQLCIATRQSPSGDLLGLKRRTGGAPGVRQQRLWEAFLLLLRERCAKNQRHRGRESTLRDSDLESLGDASWTDFRAAFLCS